jgi:hypothetical protein
MRGIIKNYVYDKSCVDCKKAMKDEFGICDKHHKCFLAFCKLSDEAGIKFRIDKKGVVHDYY